ncbi:MAG: hypothetical protein ACKVOE_06975 [Rickettsiales bacterium]
MTLSTEILTDAFLHRLWPAHAEVTLRAMQSLDVAAYQASAPWAAMGALLASTLLYLIGVRLRRLPKHISDASQQARIETIRHVASAWLPWLLFMGPTPVGGVLVLAAGFFGVKPWIATLMLVSGEAAWRISPLL